MRLPHGRFALGLVFTALGLASASATGCGGGDEPPEGTAGSSGAPGGTVTWCQVSEVLESKCQRCHVGDGLNGAPFSLVTFQDTQVQDASGPRWLRMRAMVVAGAMPPADSSLVPPPEKLTQQERDLLVTWFNEDARAVGGTACD